MTSFLLKIIGIITMASDHIGYIFLHKFSFFNLIGRISFPLFAFQSVQGYLHTKSFKKHIIKLLIFACISQIPFMLFLSKFSNDIYSLNVLFTFILALIAIFLYDKSKNKILGFVFVILFGFIAEFVKTDYGMYGIFLIFIFYIFKDKKSLMFFSATILTIAKYINNIILYPSLLSRFCLCILFTCLPLIFICLYNKKEGPKSKYLFYIFYPIHFIILYFLG